MSYKDSGDKILGLVGGKDNVLNLTHCLTRLRFNLKDNSKADMAGLKALSCVLGVVKNEKDFQVIIGTDVENYYRPISDMLQETTGSKEGKGNLAGRFIETVSGIFTPILPALTAAGMLQALLALLVTLKVVSNTSQTYQILSFMGNTTFYFLPVMLADSAAKKFKCNRYVAVMLGAMLIHPNFVKMVTESIETGVAIRFAGLPVYNASYSSSVIPIILGVWFMSKVEPIADRVSPKAVKFFTKPLITILISGVATLLVLGPIGYIVSTWITDGVKYMDSVAGWLVPTIIGCTLPLLVMTGIHHGLTATGINNRMTIGYDSMIYPGQLASNVAQGAAGFAVAVKAKNSQIKQIAMATSFTAMCGITEPVLFGLTMKVKTNLLATMIGGGVSGFIFGSCGIKNFSGGAPGVLTFPSYIGLDAPMSNFYLAIAGSLVGAVVAFVIAFILYKDPEEEMIEDERPQESKADKVLPEQIMAPVKGNMIPLKEVNDPTFSEGVMGKGAGFVSENGNVFSPVKGKVVNVFPTKHALTLQSENGAEIILHIGIDTVKLNGEFFTAHVKDGQEVKPGELLLDFDKEKIEEKGYDTTVIMVIVNTDEYTEIKETGKAAVPGMAVLKLEK
ncbi:PTS beta-glucoside transporter subunit EIIBCA [bacterium C-53]|nr:PTS beta-glucoside transporter subunit EIIBCA [Lachnospiraceae bacterium]NBI03481.1 PTS beta-glucoside transporter subunit EIIBCA [Lachnospiraceae bacterium]RKJ09717.1 PTS beta-glucoside transporter subunit EIIBCA [bacterium C-53]